MPRPYASGVVPASADEVWSLIRDFNGIADWHPGIQSSELTAGSSGAEVGAVRKLGLGGDAQVSERLLTLDDADRSYTYEFTDPGPFAVRRYVSTIRVAPVTDTGHAFVEWWADFDADAADEAELGKTYARGVYGGGISALQERFGG
ncbi:SRPBCC family protein [Pseudonocardia dioxanivorans]|jgi:carbon monoxide dehydrogenase subunit G|uniref:SRPBCC family protein n=1 Tax=Pseudonocardia dioxanivorans TaxID=240495 RepID=UPI000CD1D289|nr:SRPBCC family protein [Pseudonocardia dioxanivorans]